MSIYKRPQFEFAIICFIIISCITLIDCSRLYAGIGVQPDNTEIVIPQDSVTSGTYTVVNDGKETIRVKVEPEEWLKMRGGISDVPVKDWLILDPMEFDLVSQGTKEVKYAITPPSGRKGELGSMIYFSTAAPQGTFTITTRYGVSLYAAIRGTLQLACNINNVSIRRNVTKDDAGKETDKGLVFTVFIENKGNVHLRPTGSIAIEAEDGSEYNVKIGRNFPVYAGKETHYLIPWEKIDILPQKYEADINLDYGSLYKEEGRAQKKISFVIKKDGTVSF